MPSRKSNSDSTHECPAPDCRVRVAFERLACPRHWREVPYPLRNQLNYLWREDPGSDAYFSARGRCLVAMGVAEADLADLNAGVI